LVLKKYFTFSFNGILSRCSNLYLFTIKNNFIVYLL
jgi:hypothetical protein